MPRLRQHHFWIIAGVAVVAIAALLFAKTANPPAENDTTVVVYKHPQCGCCVAWVEHLRQAGFEVETRAETEPERRWERHGVPPRLGSCHTAVIGDYVVEGHVPAEDIRRLLDERPDAVGLVLPGMPIGSPGMEGPNPEAFEVLLVKEDGSTEVWARHTP